MGLPARPQPAFRTRSCYWSLLKQGVVKINVVGALRGIPRISGMGARFRDDMGNFLLFTYLAKTSCHEEPIQGSGNGSHTSADPVVYYHKREVIVIPFRISQMQCLFIGIQFQSSSVDV
ncbi:hypothetical protein IFM89_006902 [Coptis chinensis]|uniref:Uncharacterized protein n=1 Tax=Coptis chinensis TaxID=261450 RepID=A0A835LAD5_9MAGN|nr:hypothetical protein IFM89_006902 [Coptis chinensis]